MLMSVDITYIENFPNIGTIEDPAYAWINRKLLLGYQIAPVDGGGCALLLFNKVSDASIFPLNVEGFGKKSGLYVPEFPIEPWTINEIQGDSKTQYWKVLKKRRWVISFMDYTMDILFEDVELKEVSTDIKSPAQLLLDRTHLLKGK